MGECRKVYDNFLLKGSLKRMLYSVFSKQCVESLEKLSSPQPRWVTVAVVANIGIQLGWGLNRAKKLLIMTF